MKGTVFWDKYHEAMDTKNTVEIESYYAAMDTWFAAKIYPSHDGLTVIYKNINERKKAEEAIKPKSSYLLKVSLMHPRILFTSMILRKEKIFM